MLTGWSRVIIALSPLLFVAVGYAESGYDVFCSTELSDFVQGREYVRPFSGPLHPIHTEGGFSSVGIREDATTGDAEAFEHLASGIWSPRAILGGLSSPSGPQNKRFVEALCPIVYEMPGFPWKMADYDYGMISDNNALFVSLAELHHLKHLELFTFRMPEAAFSEVSRLEHLEYLGLPQNATDAYISQVTGVRQLQYLNASCTKIEGYTLSTLGVLPELQILDLRRNRLHGPTLRQLADCKSLETLLLAHSTVKDEDIACLLEVPSLKYLTLNNTGITDAALETLSAHKGLKYVSVYLTGVTPAACDAFRLRNPQLTVDMTVPPTRGAFVQARLDLYARAGNTVAQWRLVDAMRSKLARTQMSDRGPVRIELLKWYYVLRENPDAYPERLAARFEKEIAQLETDLSEAQVREARSDAEAVQDLQRRAKFDLSPKKTEGLPLYQYSF